MSHSNAGRGNSLPRPLTLSNYMKNLADITPAQFRRAADIREQIGKLAHELHVIFGLSEDAKTVPLKTENPQPLYINPFDAMVKTSTKRRRMSKASRAKISAAAKLRWRKARAKGRNSL